MPDATWLIAKAFGETSIRYGQPLAVRKSRPDDALNALDAVAQDAMVKRLLCRELPAWAVRYCILRYGPDDQAIQSVPVLAERTGQDDLLHRWIIQGWAGRWRGIASEEHVAERLGISRDRVQSTRAAVRKICFTDWDEAMNEAGDILQEAGLL